jgi:hypothetical protein
MTNFHHIGLNFHKERSSRIGASDVPAIIPNPEKPTESLAGYERTAVTVYQEKVGEKERDPAGVPAEMGHYLEAKSLELAVRQLVSYEAGVLVRIDALRIDNLVNQGIELTPSQMTTEWKGHKFYHRTQYYTDDFIAHPDLIWLPGPDSNFEEEPIIIEAKSARLYATKRPEGSIVKGYDFDLKTWQGIPLKHYVQVQFQLALFEIKTAYLSLIYDTSSHAMWQIEANRDHQSDIINICSKLAHCIKTKQPPKDLIINQADVKDLYPSADRGDFTILSGEELEKATEYAREGKYAAKQEKIWKSKKIEANDALSVIMKDRGEIRDSNGTIAKWAFKKGYEKIMALGAMKDLDGYHKYYRYLKRNGLIVPPGEGSRSVSIKFKE